MTIETNGRFQRKQLSNQLDRFDTMLDGLSEALNETIAGAVRDGTRLALKDAVVEILTDPALRSKLRDATEPVKAATEPATNPSFWQAAKAKASAAGRALKSAASTTASFVANAAVSVVATVRNPGLAIAVVSFFARHALSTAISAITAAAAAVSIHARQWTRRSMQIFVD